MPLILAIEPDRRQAAQLSVVVRKRVHAELILVDTTERALDAIGNRMPDLVLVPALLSPQDDAALAAALRVIAAAAHVQMLTIPVLGTPRPAVSAGGDAVGPPAREDARRPSPMDAIRLCSPNRLPLVPGTRGPGAAERRAARDARDARDAWDEYHGRRRRGLPGAGGRRSATIV